MSNVFFYEPFYDFDRLLDEAFCRSPFNQGGRSAGNQPLRRGSDNDTFDGAVRSFRPRMDLHEDNERNVVTATFELPGVNREDINIDLTHGNRLTISAETKQDVERNEDGYAIKERRFGKFARTLNVPSGTKDEDIKASIEKGVLTVTFPKSQPEQAPKKITIS